MVLVFITAFLILMFLLYRQGLATSKCIRAILFVFRRGTQRDSASFNSCTGWVRHMVLFRQSQLYEFSLDCQLLQGEAHIILLDHHRRELLHLNQYKAVGSANLKNNTPYVLRWEFKNATGKCELRWQ